ncbi:hypothetical protein G8759_31920 [Spirosoma aureum]|uniref:DUF748 domain-containing protein n=1 Tax=Spirosoma aureum TaxID=2692134 RepID=A0A6G9AX54_9BACT|nr:hypothetical protein [Spirosoma aureum]QIP16919.1 hypothetical protein G8759_31920 [Spirosoma aureum]
MNISLKRWVKLLLLLAAIPFLIVGVAYFILVSKLKDVMEFAVWKQTKGGYALNSKDIKLSIFDKTVRIDDLVFTRKDTRNVPVYYDVKIPKAHLSIESWRELLVNKRLLIDSFLIEKPEVVIHDYKVHEKNRHQTSFHTSMILENLQKTLDHLHAKSFVIQEGSLTLFKRNSAEPLRIKNVTLTVHNFLKIDNNDKRLFGSDNLELALGRQRWVLSDGKNILSFRGLRFSSASQLFEIDSVHFHKPATAEQDEVILRAEKFYFNSKHLPAIYQKGELSLDTLICVRPVLTLPLTTQRVPVKDTSIHSNIKSLFKNVAIRYTEIKDGEILLGSPKNNALKAGTQKANLNIFNLKVNPQNEHLITTDSINLNLNNISFFSKDSLFKISVERFTLLNDDVLFKNVHYGPASPKVAGKGMTFTAPALRLNNISLDDLIRKRLVATDAELVNPNITLIATRKEPSKPRITANHDTVTRKKTDIYQTLNSFGELLRVDRFHIINGSGQYKLAGKTKPVHAELKGLNALIMVKDLLASDSLIKIKRAIADLKVEQMNVAANGLKMQLSRYRMNGRHRFNWVDKLQIDLASGITIAAGKLYWEAFSWDVLQQTKVIQIDQVRVQDLLVDAKIKPKVTAAEPVVASADKPQAKGLPKLRIRKLLADHLKLKASLPKNVLAGFEGYTIDVSELTTDPTYFRWAQFLGNLNNLYFRQPNGKQIAVAQIALHSHQHTVLSDIRYAANSQGKIMQVVLPKMQIKGPFPSTDFTNISLSSVLLDRPEVTMLTEPKQQSGVSATAKAFSIPLNLALHELNIKQARLNLITKKGKDSTQLQTVVDVEAKSIHARKHEDATFASIRVSPADLKLAMPKIKTTVQSVNVQLTNGKLLATKDGKPSLTTHLLANLTLHDLHPTLTSKKNTTPPELRIKGVAGTIDMPNFRWTAGQKMAWPTFVDHANVAITDLSFKSARSTIKAGKVSWDHKYERLQLDNFQLSPLITKEEFMTPPNLQSDYITIQGEQAQLNGVKAVRWYRDSTLVVNHIVVKNIITDVSRDKRLPDPAVLPNKLMPTRLISGIKVPFHIDSISVINSQVNYHETSKITNRVGTVPLKDINGTLKTVTNRPTKSTDSLKLLASTKLLGLHIKRLHYRESYGDSLSGFHMLLRTSDLNMPELSPITNPMAAADLEDGYLEPIMARIAGNKYASVGNMRFYYKNLKLRLLGHKDTTRRSLLIKFENFVASKILRKKNQQEARIFYDRDQKKFIFGYWIKSIMSGVLTSVGVKANKKYHANYLKLSQQHTLPAED